MKIWGVSIEQLNEIMYGVDGISNLYDGNITFNREPEHVSKPCIACTLRVEDSKGRGAKLSTSGRRTIAADWQVHKEFMSYIFTLNPQARIQTALADYHGVGDFLSKFMDTYYTNVGSVMNPQFYGDL